MKHLLTLSLFLGLSSFVFAQQMTQQVPLIEVEGYAERKIAPDEAVFTISLEEKSLRVNDAVTMLNKKAQILAEGLKKAKIKNYQLIADNYSVDVNRIYRSGSSRDSGYVARQTLRIVTTPVNEDLHKISDAIQSSGDMSYNFHFGIAESTRKSLENTLLAEALKDAESRALLIGSTLKLQGMRVFYVGMEPNYSPQPRYDMNVRVMADAAPAPEMVINPDQQTISKRVYVKYTY